MHIDYDSHQDPTFELFRIIRNAKIKSLKSLQDNYVNLCCFVLVWLRPLGGIHKT